MHPTQKFIWDKVVEKLVVEKPEAESIPIFK
jgi:hypothetical protein